MRYSMNKVHPLKSITIEQAAEKQFKLVDCMTRNFTGLESLTRGDLGVKKENNKPEYTLKAEKAIAQFFDAEDCILVRGAGTGAIRYGLSSIVNPNEKILIHDAPAYTTTQVSFEMFNLNTVKADFNDLNDVKRIIKENPDLKAALIQYSRQKKYDSYSIEEVIRTIKDNIDIPVITDDNYAVMKVDKVGCEYGSDLTTFSCFKLQGPEGIGCIVGREEYIQKIKKMHYSGGCQVQGWEALETLRGLVYAPVILAVQAVEAEKIINDINEIDGIADAYIANAQSKVILVELEKPIARKVLEEAEKLGALPSPVGAESKYDIVPLFYKVSGTFLKEDPSLIDRMIRINPNRAGKKTTLRILSQAIDNASD